MRHPFLESTYLNIGIYNRSLKKFAESLMMFKRLEILQKQVYGDKHILLLYTYKNIGTCYLGIGNSVGAKKYFRDCLELVEGVEYDSDKPDLKHKDEEERSLMYQNLYLTYVSEREYQNAIECTEKVIEIMSNIYGPRSKRIASKHYQLASSNLNMNKKPAAIKNIETAIDIHENSEDDKWKPKGAVDTAKEGHQGTLQQEAQAFNRLQYQNLLSSCLFIYGQDFDRVIKEAEKGI
jgi:tetratricopeptide (TPR) repeat protein